MYLGTSCSVSGAPFMLHRCESQNLSVGPAPFFFFRVVACGPSKRITLQPLGLIRLRTCRFLQPQMDGSLYVMDGASNLLGDAWAGRWRAGRGYMREDVCLPPTLQDCDKLSSAVSARLWWPRCSWLRCTLQRPRQTASG